ncbi:K02A2.6-like [Cordylochernes scorpioides]|uniref:K02A2.6-like n=1 Tax=Cordylochernes scorpioides TaxID=51811 RepID=A0ABY6KDN5_9ARAC|nr:K02A2.6-like [Cordylochernes scorpioides]
MYHFKPPSQFELTTNNAEAWETWKFKFLLYSDAIQLETKPFKKKDQSFDDFVTKVKNKAVDCDFVDLTESLIRDRIVLGVLDKYLTEKVSQDPDLTLSKAIALGRAVESSRTQLKEIKEEVTVNKLSSYKETSSNRNTEHKFAKKNHKFFKACENVPQIIIMVIAQHTVNNAINAKNLIIMQNAVKI